MQLSSDFSLSQYINNKKKNLRFNYAINKAKKKKIHKEAGSY